MHLLELLPLYLSLAPPTQTPFSLSTSFMVQTSNSRLRLELLDAAAPRVSAFGARAAAPPDKRLRRFRNTAAPCFQPLCELSARLIVNLLNSIQIYSNLLHSIYISI